MAVGPFKKKNDLFFRKHIFNYSLSTGIFVYKTPLESCIMLGES